MRAPQFNTIYQFYKDEVARLATISIEDDASPSLSGGESYGPDSLVDDNPAKVAKIGATSGAWIFAYAEKQRIDIAALIHHTFDETPAGSPGSPTPSVRLEGNATSDFSNPTFVATFTIPPWFGEGTRRWPVNPYLVLTEVEGYDPEGFLFWRLVIENNSQNIQLGQVWFGSTTHIITIPAVAGVIYSVDGVDKTAGALPAITETTEVEARAAAGYSFPHGTDADWVFVY